MVPSSSWFFPVFSLYSFVFCGMVTIKDMSWVVANNMDAGRADVGRRSIDVSLSTVNFRGSHLSIFSQSLFHW